MARVTSFNNFDVTKDITFSESKSTGKYEKITISKSDGKKLIIETEECFSWGVQKSENYITYSLPLVFRNGSQSVRVFNEILQRVKDHMSGSTKAFGKCLYANLERGTTTVHPKLDQYNGKFNTKFFERDDVEVSPLKYMNVRCSVRTAIWVDGLLIGEKTFLQLKLREVEVSPIAPPAPPPVEKKKKRLLSSNPVKRKLFEDNNEEVKTPVKSGSCIVIVVSVV